MSIAEKSKRFLNRDSWLFLVVRAIYTFFRKIYEGGFSLVFRIFPIQKNKIIINNHHGKGYGDNAKYIVEKLLKSNVNLDVVWVLRNLTIDEAGLPQSIRTVKFRSLRYIYEMTTAKIWLENNRVYQHLFKRKEQYYIQTWHGGLGLKKIEGDAPYGMNKRNISFAKRDSSMADLFISNSKHLSDIYRRAFWYEGEILECGYPKNDILFTDKKNYRKKIRTHYDLDESCKILLYAPTFRESKSLDNYDINFELLSGALNSKRNETWAIIIRLHPSVDSSSFYQKFPKTVINGSSFPDMQEMVLGIDILVTDYSSCMFDSAIANIPTFLYASDIKSYMDDRGFYFSLNNIPFSVSENTKQLVNAINSFDSKEYQDSLEEFYKKVGLYDRGTASQEVAKLISSIL